MIKSSVITNRLSITMAGLIIDYLFSSDSVKQKTVVWVGQGKLMMPGL